MIWSLLTSAAVIRYDWRILGSLPLLDEFRCLEAVPCQAYTSRRITANPGQKESLGLCPDLAVDEIQSKSLRINRERQDFPPVIHEKGILRSLHQVLPSCLRHPWTNAAYRSRIPEGLNAVRN